MPPKAKFSREEIVQAGLAIVREEGLSGLTARALGARLGSSARPVFTVFAGMEEVESAVIAAARAVYSAYVREGMAEAVPFRGVGKQYIRFAVREPRLFQLLFMQEAEGDLKGILPAIEEHYAEILQSVRDSYGVDGETAEGLYCHLWIYTHGIAALCATGTCRFTEAEIVRMMGEVMAGLLRLHRPKTAGEASRAAAEESGETARAPAGSGQETARNGSKNDGRKEEAP